MLITSCTKFNGFNVPLKPSSHTLLWLTLVPHALDKLSFVSLPSDSLQIRDGFTSSNNQDAYNKSASNDDCDVLANCDVLVDCDVLAETSTSTSFL